MPHSRCIEDLTIISGGQGDGGGVTGERVARLGCVSVFVGVITAGSFKGDLRIVFSSCVSGDTFWQEVVTLLRLCSIFGDKPKHYLFLTLTLTKCFLCLNLTSSNQNKLKIEPKDTQRHFEYLWSVETHIANIYSGNWTDRHEHRIPGGQFACHTSAKPAEWWAAVLYVQVHWH